VGFVKATKNAAHGRAAALAASLRHNKIEKEATWLRRSYPNTQNLFIEST